MNFLELSSDFACWLWIAFWFLSVVIGFLGLPLWTFTLLLGLSLLLLPASQGLLIFGGIVLLFLLILNLPPIRKILFSAPIVSVLKRLNILPEISQTEQTALEAGSTWVDKELFSGKPDFEAIRKNRYGKLNEEERLFIDNQVEKLCSMMTDWEIFEQKDLSKEVWDYLRKEKFFGLVIPKEDGGLGFSALANSEVVAKISSRSMALAVTVMVPNSLGPGELIHLYGTDEQKKHFLPRLADGREIPCFALTEPEAGSDAGSMKSHGVVFKGDDGKLYIRLTWSKRYITLAAISTILGLAVKLEDPDQLLGDVKDIGITCVLVPTKAEGVECGRRHNPMGVPFYNCPIHGENVVISIDQIIGGPKYAGQGWKMLMECLAIGRSISLPAQATGGSKMLLRVASAYAVARKQFGIEIGKFEGIGEPLARIGGLTYLLEASRIFTVGAVDSGVKPSVVSAIAKYNSTEIGRLLINDGMDILAGAGISRGPRNLLANNYIAAPIGITVEGANILTRSMIIFGQGAIRCHPFAYNELKALQENNLTEFDKAFWGHVGFVVRNTFRAVLLTFTRGFIAAVPSGPMRPYYRKLAWASASFALMSDVALASYGGGLKFKEHISGRYADALSWMYLAMATIQRFESEGRQKEHQPYADWAIQYSFYKVQQAFEAIFANIKLPLGSFLFNGPILWCARFNAIGSMPKDDLTKKVVDGILVPGKIRDDLAPGVYLPSKEGEALQRYESALIVIHSANEVYKKIHAASKAKTISRGKPDQLIEEALAKNVISIGEKAIIDKAEAARNDLIQVDSFALNEFESA